MYVLYDVLYVHESWQVREAAGSRYRLGPWQVWKHLRVGVVVLSPKYPESVNEAGHMSMHTLDPSHANVGDGHAVTHSLVTLYP